MSQFPACEYIIYSMRPNNKTSFVNSKKNTKKELEFIYLKYSCIQNYYTLFVTFHVQRANLIFVKSLQSNHSMQNKHPSYR